MNLLIVGVGGQGVVLASNILAEAALQTGVEVKKTDSLGMAQRGGSVVSHLRWGKTVFSPLLAQGTADIVIAFEKLEGARWAHFLKPGGVMIMNDISLPPLAVSSGGEVYPDDAQIRTAIERITLEYKIVPATKIALGLGNAKLVNTILLGYSVRFLNLPEDLLGKTIEESLPPRLRQINARAFTTGLNVPS